MARRRSVPEQLVELIRYRELILNLTRKELAIRYQNSVLGFAWSMLQPVFLLVVYGIAFRILGAGFDDFSVWVLCGLLVWTFVQTALLTATKSITENYALVGKVKFPRSVLPISAISSAIVHLMLQSVAFAALLLVLRHPVDWAYMALVPVALLTAIVFVTALSLILAPLNVYARDTIHLLDLLLLGWFWLTPILYQYQLGASFVTGRGLPGWALLANPLTPIVISIQRAVYGTDHIGNELALLPSYGPQWYLLALVITLVASLVVCWIALWVFDRAEVNLVEAL